MTPEELETEMERNINLIIDFQLFMYENGFISDHLWDFERMAIKFLSLVSERE